MSAPNHGSTDQTTTSLPSPVAGFGSTDLTTDSNDPQELRALLERARERLSYYESFDKIIAENLRRTGEMMAETVALREQAAQEMKMRQAADEAIEAERARSRALLEGVLFEVHAARPVIDAMVARLQGALDELHPAEPTAPDPEASLDVPAPEVESGSQPERLTPDVPDLATPDSADAPLTEEPPAETQVAEEPEPEVPATPAADAAPSTIEILAHGVPSAATAIGLQQMLREIDVISRVDTREFADGELRLHLECSGTIPDDTFTEWLARNSGSLVSRNAKAIELSFS